MRTLQNIERKALLFAQKAGSVLKEKRAASFLEIAIALILAAVLGALLIAGLVGLFNSDIMPGIKEKISAIFSFSVT